MATTPNMDYSSFAPTSTGFYGMDSGAGAVNNKPKEVTNTDKKVSEIYKKQNTTTFSIPVSAAAQRLGVTALLLSVAVLGAKAIAASMIIGGTVVSSAIGGGLIVLLGAVVAIGIGLLIKSYKNSKNIAKEMQQHQQENIGQKEKIEGLEAKLKELTTEESDVRTQDSMGTTQKNANKGNAPTAFRDI